jgi:hypothetical protein
MFFTVLAVITIVIIWFNFIDFIQDYENLDSISNLISMS